MYSSTATSRQSLLPTDAHKFIDPVPVDEHHFGKERRTVGEPAAKTQTHTHNCTKNHKCQNFLALDSPQGTDETGRLRHHKLPSVSPHAHHNVPRDGMHVRHWDVADGLDHLRVLLLCAHECRQYGCGFDAVAVAEEAEVLVQRLHEANVPELRRRVRDSAKNGQLRDER
jgi:hypothetical protein